MKANRAMKIVVDIALSAVLVATMSTALVQEVPHEWLGIALFVLMVTHVVLNRKWILGIMRSRRKAPYTLHLILIAALLVCLVGMIASSLVLSKHVFGFLPALPGASWARRIHMLFSYWMFVIAFAHVGLHIRIPRRMAPWKLRVMRVAAAAVAAYGVYAFARLGLFAYLTGQVQFAMADFDTPLAVTFARYTGVAALVAIAFHGVQAALTAAGGRR
ncbi:MAG: DUF4405 domain-containing protein [Atopobiaceae bacterium]|nr:DUF4405 domain-containing protein [Atopobiaceae bacterium]